MLCAVSAVAASVNDSDAGKLGGRRAVLAMNQPMPVPADVPSKLLRTGSHTRPPECHQRRLLLHEARGGGYWF